MIQLENLTIKGFCSIDTFSINLNQKGITLIKGPNGVGKSTWLSALVWVIYGKNLKGVTDVNTWPKYRTKDYQGTIGELYWKSGSYTYKLVRCLNYKGVVEGAKGANRLLLFKDAMLVDDKKKANIQDAISSAIGMSYSLFMSSIMFGQGMKRLIQETNSDKKNLFEEIFNLRYITEAQQIAKGQYQEILSKFRGLETIYATLNSSLEATKNNLDLSIEKTKEFRKINKQKIDSMKERKKLAAKAICEIGAIPTNNYQGDLQKLTIEVKEAQKVLLGLEEKSESLTLEQVINEVLGLLEEKQTKKAYTRLVEVRNIFTRIDTVNTHLKDLRAKVYKVEKSISQVELLQEKLRSKQRELKTITDRISELKSEEAPTINTQLSNKIATIQESLLAKKAELEALQGEADTMKWVYMEPLGPSGLKAYIFDSSVNELNDILKSYSDTLGIHIMFMIDTSTNRKDFETIVRLEGTLVLYEELSGGQKQLVHLAMALAMNQLVTSKHQVNLAFMDEVFESLSFDNIELVVALLRKVYKDKNLFLVSHYDSLPIGNTRTIAVSKDLGLSQYKF